MKSLASLPISVPIQKTGPGRPVVDRGGRNPQLYEPLPHSPRGGELILSATVQRPLSVAHPVLLVSYEPTGDDAGFERTFLVRTPAKDFENRAETLVTLVTLASIQLTLGRLARPWVVNSTNPGRQCTWPGPANGFRPDPD